MAVPENVRLVKRPVNTIVDDNGGDGLYRYAVCERAGAKYVAGGNPRPSDGRVVGHIIGDQFVPQVEKTAISGPETLSYGSAALVKSVTRDIFSDHLDVYPAWDA
jgi:hypothetical protein